MANPTVFQAVQVGAENIAAKGVPVACNKRFAATDIQLRRQGGKKIRRAMGSKYNTQALTSREWTSAPISGDQSFPELVYLLEMSGAGIGTVTTPGGAVNTRRRVWNPVHNKPVSVRTLTIERGSPWNGFGRRASYCHAPDLGFSWTEDDATVSGNVIGKKLARGVTIAGNEIQTITFADGDATAESLVFSGQTTVGEIDPTTTAEELLGYLESLSNIAPGDVLVTGGPFPTPLRVEFVGQYAQTNVAQITTENVNPDITIATLVAGGSETELPEVRVGPTEVCLAFSTDGATWVDLFGLGLDLSINGAFAQQKGIACDEPSWSNMVERAPEISGRLTIDDEEKAVDFLDMLRDNEIGFIRVRSTSDHEIEEGFPYRYEFKVAIQFTEDEPGTENDYETAGFSWVGFKSSVLNNSAFRLEVDTAIVTL